MISDRLTTAIKLQINMELTASYLYLAMSSYFSHREFPGAASWFKMQSDEEISHATKLYDYVVDVGGRVELFEIPTPKQEFDSFLEVFQTAFAHEQKVSAAINDLYELAFQEKAFATQAHLQWFLLEQVEEEKTIRHLVMRLKAIGSDQPALLDFDKDLAERGPEIAEEDEN
jgi:ferritin